MEYKARNIFERRRHVPTWIQWSEVFGLTILVMAAGFWVRPEDPFYLKGEFPWLLLAPVVAALRYGFSAGLMSAVLLFLSMLGYIKFTVGDVAHIPFGYVVGLLVITMIAGEFRDYWQHQLDILQQANNYRQVRLDEFTRSYHLLKVSHDRLEMQLAGRGQSLREALRYLQRHLHQFGAELTPGVAKSILNILVEYGSLQTAAVVPVLPSGEVSSTALAEVGELYKIDPQDPMIQSCLETKELVSVKASLLEKGENRYSEYLIVVPLVDSEGRLYGVVVVKRIPFFALERQTLTLLAVLTGHMADLLYFYRFVSGGEDEDELEFKVNVKRVLIDCEKYNVPSSVVIIWVPNDEKGQALVRIVLEMRRGLDMVWVQTEKDPNLLLVEILLPLTDEMGLAGYKQRLEDNVRQRFGQDVEAVVKKIGYHSLTTAADLKHFLEKMGVH